MKKKFSTTLLILILAHGITNAENKEIKPDSTTNKNSTTIEESFFSVPIQEVVVTGSRTLTTTQNVPVTVSSISREQLLESQSTNILPSLMQEVPGLMITERGVMGYGVSGGAAGGINIRGVNSSSGQVLVLIDGQPQYQGIFGHSISDSYQTMLAEKVEVVRGPASMLYGSNALGGVINIITRKQTEQGLKAHINLGAGSYNTFQGSGNLDMLYGRFSSTIAASYSRSDNHRENMGFEQTGALVKLGCEISKNWDISAQADITYFNASNPGTIKEPLHEADQNILRGVASLALKNRYEKVNGSVSVYDNFGFHKINDGYKDGQDPQKELFNSEDHLIGVSAYENLQLFSGSNITIGLDYQHIYGHAWYTDRNSGEIVETGKRKMQSTNSNVDEIAGYINISQRFNSIIALNAGVRYDYHSIAKGNWIPEFGIIVSPIQNGDIKLNASRGFRNPTIKDMYLYAVANHDSLYAESIWNAEASWEHRLKKVKYGANIYYMIGSNMIQTIAGRNVNSGKIQNLGIEADITWNINANWTLSSNHSYIHMWYPVIGTPRYKGYIGAHMLYGKWKASVGLQQLVGLYISNGENAQTNNATLVNASVSYQPWKQFEVWVKGNNLLAQQYELNAGYPMPRATVMAGINLNF